MICYRILHANVIVQNLTYILIYAIKHITMMLYHIEMDEIEKSENMSCFNKLSSLHSFKFLLNFIPMHIRDCISSLRRHLIALLSWTGAIYYPYDNIRY